MVIFNCNIISSSVHSRIYPRNVNGLEHSMYIDVHFGCTGISECNPITFVSIAQTCLQLTTEFTDEFPMIMGTSEIMFLVTEFTDEFPMIMGTSDIIFLATAFTDEFPMLPVFIIIYCIVFFSFTYLNHLHKMLCYVHRYGLPGVATHRAP